MIGVIKIEEAIKKTAAKLAWLRGMRVMRSAGNSGGRFLAGINREKTVFKLIDMGDGFGADYALPAGFKVRSAAQKNRFVVYETEQPFTTNSGIRRMLSRISHPFETDDPMIFPLNQLLMALRGMPGRVVFVEFIEHPNKAVSIVFISNEGAVAMVNNVIKRKVGDMDINPSDAFQDVDLTFEVE